MTHFIHKTFEKTKKLHFETIHKMPKNGHKMAKIFTNAFFWPHFPYFLFYQIYPNFIQIDTKLSFYKIFIDINHPSCNLYFNFIKITKVGTQRKKCGQKSPFCEYFGHFVDIFGHFVDIFWPSVDIIFYL
jgi:hypothetical protein